jgi:hypothetical protein
MDASGAGKVLGDFIKGLYWAIGTLALLLVVAVGVIIWLIVR